MSDADASDYDKLKKALLTRYNYTEYGYRKMFREATPETEETPDQFVIRLKNYLAKWLQLSGSSPQKFVALVDLIVKEQFINACSEDLATTRIFGTTLLRITPGSGSLDLYTCESLFAVLV